MSEALIGYGSQIQLDDGAGNYVTIAEVVDADIPGPTTGLEDATNMDSPDATTEDIAGLNQNNNITIAVNYLPGHTTQTYQSANGIEKLLSLRATRSFRAILPDDAETTLTQDVIIISFGKKINVKNKMVATLVVRPTGQPVWTEGNP